MIFRSVALEQNIVNGVETFLVRQWSTPEFLHVYFKLLPQYRSTCVQEETELQFNPAEPASTSDWGKEQESG